MNWRRQISAQAGKCAKEEKLHLHTMREDYGDDRFSVK